MGIGSLPLSVFCLQSYPYYLRCDDFSTLLLFFFFLKSQLQAGMMQGPTFLRTVHEPCSDAH